MNAPPGKNEAPDAGSAESLGSNHEFFTEADGVNGPARAAGQDLDCLTEPSELACFMTGRDVLGWQVKRAALLALLNIETRPFSEVAASLGVKRQAVSVAYTRLCDRLGWEPMFRRIETRKKYAEAANRRHTEKKKAAA